MIELIDGNVYRDGTLVFTLTKEEMDAMDSYIKWIQMMRAFRQSMEDFK